MSVGLQVAHHACCSLTCILMKHKLSQLTISAAVKSHRCNTGASRTQGTTLYRTVSYLLGSRHDASCLVKVDYRNGVCKAFKLDGLLELSTVPREVVNMLHVPLIGLLKVADGNLLSR